ncbi:MAG: FHA domain-containing protein [Deltaproteobacteria bacterium]|nr:FHA domain-containing protein [Deltaproteobacteria bacterium]MBW2395105.1 FHA domain-containing protein [Deltaproteobacteria bacterium]
MSTILHVHLSIDGEPLAEIPFSSDRLQVGRLEENDIVVRDRAASRTHALLERVGEQVYVEDLGSQNGIWLGGQRIEGRVEIGPADELRIGRHTLRVGAPGAEAPVSSEPEVSTELAFKPLASGTSSETAVEASTALAAVAAWEGPEELSDVDPFSISDEDLAEAAVPLEDGALWSVGLTEDGLGEPDEILESGEPEPELQEATGDAVAPGVGFPGLIVQRSGQLDRILAWDEDELCAGRGAECEIFLGAREISRRHALFVRSNDVYEVRDLDSVNGVFVNGERVHQRILTVGDIVQIETFELTFVLECEPIGSEIQTGADVLDPQVEHTDPLSTTLQARSPLILDEADAAEAGDLASAAADGEAETALTAMEADEFETAVPHADEKELELAPLTFEKSAAAPLVLEVELAPENLPEPLRRALQELEETEESVDLTFRVKLKRS